MSEDIIEDGFGTAAAAVCPTCGERAVYVVRPGDIRCANCEEIEHTRRRVELDGVSSTGTCASCGKKFPCECTWRVVGEPRGIEWGGMEHTEPEPSKPFLEEGDKWKIKDLIHTIDMHCQIAKLIIEQERDDLLPSTLEDIHYFAQALQDFFIKGE